MHNTCISYLFAVHGKKLANHEHLSSKEHVHSQFTMTYKSHIIMTRASVVKYQTQCVASVQYYSRPSAIFRANN